jgi:nucleoside-diphosphate-sugar epimerase
MDSRNKVKILVAGGAGYIGSKLVPVLIEHGYDVTVIDLLWFGNNLPKNVKVIKKDLFDCKSEEFIGFDQLIYLAGLSNDPMAEFNPAKNFIYNGALPTYLAFEAKKAGIKRFIYASSCSIYGYTTNQLYDEDSPATCAYPYGISKLQGESGVFQMQDSSFSCIALRQGTVSGYSPRMRYDLIVNTMFKTCLKDNKIVVNNPSIWRPILDIRDAVSAYLRAVQADLSLSGVFNISSGNYTVGQVGDQIKFWVEKKIKVKINLELLNIQDFRNYKVSIVKAQTLLGFQPQFSIEETVEDLFENLEKISDFSNEHYYNINVFKKIVF